jgi:predicted ArsR family transcriptional regulator
MESACHPQAPRSNRSLPVEQWPESLDILRHLATVPHPRSIKDIARAVGAPEISTRNRLSRLEAAGTVSAHRGIVATPSGKSAVGTQYRITQHGRDCAGAAGRAIQTAVPSIWGRATSVFAWSAVPKT